MGGKQKTAFALFVDVSHVTHAVGKNLRDKSNWVSHTAGTFAICIRTATIRVERGLRKQHLFFSNEVEKRQSAEQRWTGSFQGETGISFAWP